MVKADGYGNYDTGYCGCCRRMDQDGYTQGYRPLFILGDLLQKGQEPESEFLYTDIVIKTKYNS